MRLDHRSLRNYIIEVQEKKRLVCSNLFKCQVMSNELKIKITSPDSFLSLRELSRHLKQVTVVWSRVIPATCSNVCLSQYILRGKWSSSDGNLWGTTSQSFWFLNCSTSWRHCLRLLYAMVFHVKWLPIIVHFLISCIFLISLLYSNNNSNNNWLVNDIVHHTMSAAHLPSRLEPTGLSHDHDIDIDNNCH